LNFQRTGLKFRLQGKANRWMFLAALSCGQSSVWTRLGWFRRRRADFGALQRGNKSNAFGLEIAVFGAVATRHFMTLEEASKRTRECALKMNDRYGRVVFDEWAVVSLTQQKARILAYTGPRNDDFLKNFVNDLGALRAALLNSKFNAGDFEFARHGTGTGFEAFMVLGGGIHLICNNTSLSMNDIARDPRWLSAQVFFAELSDAMRADPLVPAL
jgi:hypothetical protein